MKDFRISIDQFRRLNNPLILKSEYKDILDNITNRINYILREVMTTKMGWWDYYGNQDGSSYEEDGNIILDGEFSIPEPYEYTDFPTRWLWEDFEEEFRSDIETFKKEKESEKVKLKDQRESLKIKKAEMKEIISSKLSKEELKYIKFK